MRAWDPGYELVMLLLRLTAVICKDEWGYSAADGPLTWASSYEQCSGKSQSPINIQRSVREKSPAMQWINYDVTPDSFVVTNYGRSVRVEGEYEYAEDNPLLVYNGTSYFLDAVHFHWGRVDREGSEHAVEGKKFPLEMHAVHKSELGKVLVIATFFQLSSTRNPVLNVITSRLGEVQRANTSLSDVSPFPWTFLLPQFTSDFYSYTGSLTTPPCTEEVTWILNKQQSYVDHAQLEEFRALRSGSGRRLTSNFRPLQALNSRHVVHFLPAREELRKKTTIRIVNKKARRYQRIVIKLTGS